MATSAAASDERRGQSCATYGHPIRAGRSDRRDSRQLDDCPSSAAVPGYNPAPIVIYLGPSPVQDRDRRVGSSSRSSGSATRPSSRRSRSTRRTPSAGTSIASTTRTSTSIAVEGDDVVGMIALRGERPFSLDEKLGNVDAYLPAGRRVCELRLLAVRPDAPARRSSSGGSWTSSSATGRARGYDLAIISGTLRQEKLYRHLGFVPFGPASARTRRRSSRCTSRSKASRRRRRRRSWPRRAAQLPARSGAAVARRAGGVRAPARVPPRRRSSARSSAGRKRGCAASSARRTSRSCSAPARSPTTSSARQISLLDAPGRRRQQRRVRRAADRSGAAHAAAARGAVSSTGASRIDLRAASNAPIAHTGAKWLWAVASETSTGMLNDLDALQGDRAPARRRALPRLRQRHRRGAARSRRRVPRVGRQRQGARRRCPGLSFVFHDARRDAGADAAAALSRSRLLRREGRHPVHALVEPHRRARRRADALRHDEPFEHIAALSSWLRPRLRELGLPILVDDASRHAGRRDDPAAARRQRDDARRRLSSATACSSPTRASTSRRRNWFQIGLMGHCFDDASRAPPRRHGARARDAARHSARSKTGLRLDG